MQLRPSIAVWITSLALLGVVSGEEVKRSPIARKDVRSLQFFLLEGDGVTHQVNSRVVVPFVVEVRDETGRPVNGLELLFHLGDSTSRAIFENGATQASARTDARGQAAPPPVLTQSEVGAVTVNVWAPSVGSTATFAVNQKIGLTTSYSKPKRSGGISKVKLITIVSISASVATILLLRAAGGSGSSASGTAAAPLPPVAIQPGPITIGGPR
jgi:hypothetical protein